MQFWLVPRARTDTLPSHRLSHLSSRGISRQRIRDTSLLSPGGDVPPEEERPALVGDAELQPLLLRCTHNDKVLAADETAQAHRLAGDRIAFVTNE